MSNKEWLITAHPYTVQRKDTDPEKKVYLLTEENFNGLKNYLKYIYMVKIDNVNQSCPTILYIVYQ